MAQDLYDTKSCGPESMSLECSSQFDWKDRGSIRRSVLPHWNERQSKATREDSSIGWAISDHLKALLDPSETRSASPGPVDCSNTQLDEHLIISAVKDGWESVLSQVDGKPQWFFLSAILDKNIMSESDKINKLPGLLSARRVYRVRQDIV